MTESTANTETLAGLYPSSGHGLLPESETQIPARKSRPTSSLSLYRFRRVPGKLTKEKEKLIVQVRVTNKYTKNVVLGIRKTPQSDIPQKPSAASVWVIFSSAKNCLASSILYEEPCQYTALGSTVYTMYLQDVHESRSLSWGTGVERINSSSNRTVKRCQQSIDIRNDSGGEGGETRSNFPEENTRRSGIENFWGLTIENHRGLQRGRCRWE